jgi:TPR repeat protein
MLQKGQQGDSVAQYQLGRGYDRGFSENKTRGEGGFPKRDETVALDWYLKSAVQGNVEATRAMSDKSRFKNGQSIKAGDDDALAEQIKWSLLSSGYEKYSTRLKNYNGIMITDQIRADGELRAKTFRDQNKLVAKYSEASKAADLATLKAKAEAGSAEDQWILGNRFNRDTSDGGNVAEALSWWRKAADQGHAKAQSNLGHCYASGTGVSKDTAVALSYYRKSADQGNAVALNNLGRFYALGVDVPKDEVQAYAYWS